MKAACRAAIVSFLVLLAPDMNLRADEIPADGALEQTVVERVRLYRQRYGLGNTLEKRVDNRGNGAEELYGTRNVRAVIPGVLYRGGANNAYHRTQARSNRNPLPDDGLLNLCREGFETTIYLYPTNFDRAQPSVRCVQRQGQEGGKPNVNKYVQLSPFDERQHKMALELVYDTLTNRSKGPVYAHCWNGWHASGYMAATALMQFCGISPDAAVAYWNAGTDGNHTSSHYERTREAIRSFHPYPEYEIPEELQQDVCPSQDGSFLP